MTPVAGKLLETLTRDEITEHLEKPPSGWLAEVDGIWARR